MAGGYARRSGWWLALAWLGAVGAAGEVPGVPAGREPEPAKSMLVELDGTGSRDPDGDTLKYEWRQVGGPAVALSDPQAAKPYFRAREPGVYRFELRVFDGRQWSDPAAVEVMVERENLRPEAIVPAEMEAGVGQAVVIDGSASRDADGDELTFRWSQAGGPPLYLEPKLLSEDKLVLAVDRPGEYDLELVVSDGRSQSEPARCRLHVRPANQLPVAKAIAPPRLVMERSLAEKQSDLADKTPTAYIAEAGVCQTGSVVVLDGRGSLSPRGLPLRYYWKQRFGPFIRDFKRPSDAELSFVPPEPGEYVFELVVSDGRSDSAAAARKVLVVKGNEPPMAVIDAPAQGTMGEWIKLDGSRSFDREGAALEYRWRQISGPNVRQYLLDPRRGSAAPSFQAAAPGRHVFQLIVFDGQRESLPAQAAVEVIAANSRPEVQVSGNLTIVPGQTAVLQGGGRDAEGDALEYSWRQISGPPLLTGVAHQASLTVTPEREGVYVFEFTASDRRNVSRPMRTTLTVSPPYPAVPQPQALTVEPPVDTAAPVATDSGAGPLPGKGKVPELSFPDVSTRPASPAPVPPAAASEPAVKNPGKSWWNPFRRHGEEKSAPPPEKPGALPPELPKTEAGPPAASTNEPTPAAETLE